MKKSPRVVNKLEHVESEGEEVCITDFRNSLTIYETKDKSKSTITPSDLLEKSPRNISIDERVSRRLSGFKSGHKSPKDKKSQTEDKKSVKKRKKEPVNPADKDLRKISKWINNILNEDIPSQRDGFFKRLKDGTILCRTLNVLKKGTIKNIHINPHLDSLVVENLNNFIDACIYSLKINRLDLFEPNDLLSEEGDILKVIDTLLKLIKVYDGQKEHFNDPVYTEIIEEKILIIKE